MSPQVSDSSLKSDSLVSPGGRGYRDLALLLRQQILNGDFLPGSRLPTERTLAETLGVTRVTIRRSLRLLEKERLVRRVQGSGTYVTPTPQRRIPLMHSYSRSMLAHAPGLQRHLVSMEQCVVDTNMALISELAPGRPIRVVRRVDQVGSMPIACDQAYLPEDAAAKLAPEDFVSIGFLALLRRKSGLQVSFMDQEVEARGVDEEIANLLRLSVGTPVLRAKEVYRDENEKAVVSFISYYHPDLITIHSRYDLNGAEE